MTDDYGSDLECVDDIDSLATELAADDPKVVAQSVYHRLITPRGTLVDDPDYGFCLEDLVERGMTPSQLRRLPSQIEAELAKDDRILATRVKADWDALNRTITIQLDIEILDGSDFSMTTTTDLSGTVLTEYLES